MALKKRPYELSIWTEKLNKNNSKIEEKGAIIGAHDMTFLGRATDITLTRELKGTNSLTFQMPDSYYDFKTGEFVHNELIDALYVESKVKLHYRNQWYEFFVKKISEKKTLKSVIKTFTCSDAFIDELSRNGYGITFDTELYNNVEELGTFTSEILDDSIWEYHPENNWGDFTEFTEEKLFKIPVDQFTQLKGYKIDFSVDDGSIPKEKQGMTIKNVYTGDEREAELSDDLMQGVFWDQQKEQGKYNSLTRSLVTSIPNDGYIYVPYGCLNFCYGSKNIDPNTMEELKYDRAATEIALDVNGKLVIAPDSVDPRTIIQFIAFPKNAILEIDDAGVIQDRDYSYFMTLEMWNEIVKGDSRYIFEDTRLVKAESLGAENLTGAEISHTFRYLTNSVTDKPALKFMGNKYVTYEGYLSDLNNNLIVKGKKYSITDRTEVNISEEIDQYTTVYNNHANEYKDLYSNNGDWIFNPETDSKYRVCSKLETRQIIPQLARNLIQNGVNIQSTDGWSPMNYLNSEDMVSSGNVSIKTLKQKSEDEKEIQDIECAVLHYIPPRKELAYVWRNKNDSNTYLYSIGDYFYKKSGNTLTCQFNKKDKKDFTNSYERVELPSGQQQIEYVYPKLNKDKYEISWTINANGVAGATNETKKVILDNESFGIINFGIIGQEKEIEKDKIYCLGIGCLSKSKSLQIKIGRGSLISEGNYHLEEEPITFSLTDLYSNAADVVVEEVEIGDKKVNLWQEVENSEEGIDPAIGALIKESFILFKSPKTIKNPYFVIHSTEPFLIKSSYLFEAYTKGRDCFSDDEVTYNYSGRELFGVEQPNNGTATWKDNHSLPFTLEQIRQLIIFEDDIMLGSTYGYQKYYIQRLRTKSWGGDQELTFDTMGKETFISETDFKDGELPLDASKYTEDNYVIETNYIDMNKCPFYKPNTKLYECDCGYDKGNKVCFYQKFGYCPYRFETEKHCRKIRTLNASQSNRFNILQELSKVFEIYPQFYIQHKDNGVVVKDQDDYLKELFFITEKGTENKIGFRYEKNLSSVDRELDSSNLVTKLYVLDVDSELSKTGLCSIKTAEDNPSKDSYIIDLSYYIEKGALDADEVEQDLWGVEPVAQGSNIPSGFLRQLGYYNEQYDKITNNIINLQDASFTELEANLTVNLEGIVTAQEQLVKIKKQLDSYTELSKSQSNLSQTQNNYQTKYNEQQAILVQLIADTFFTNGKAYQPTDDDNVYNVKGIKNPPTNFDTPALWFQCIENIDLVKETWLDQHIYPYGILGQFNKEYLQIQAWKKERASYLKLINRISSAFFQKYEPYLKEGTWSDDNYLTDNAYYFGALDVAAEGAIPKVTYNFSTIDLSPLVMDEKDYTSLYDVDLGDTTFIEDTSVFGYNQKTGLPNKIKVLISTLTDYLDDNSKNQISVQNFTTQFEDLFQQVTATVQSLTFNENIYKRSSNFTPMQSVATESLQGALDQNNLILLDTQENNIKVDNTGTRGSDINNHANKYKLDGQGLFFSNDGGAHWNIGVGPSGINADYIKVGTLDAGKIRIADSNYVYFAWDKNGISAYRDPKGINSSGNLGDAAIFNRYGLSIVQDGKIKLRAGYSYEGSTSGENEGTLSSENAQGNEVGFYLYNDSGQVIFSTNTNSSTSSNSDDSAKLSLIGEMQVSNQNLDLASSSYKYSNVLQETKFNGNVYEGISINSFFTSLNRAGDAYLWEGRVGSNDEEHQAAACAAYVKELSGNGNNGNATIRINGKDYSFTSISNGDDESSNGDIYIVIKNGKLEQYLFKAKKKTIKYKLNGNGGSETEKSAIYGLIEKGSSKIYVGLKSNPVTLTTEAYQSSTSGGSYESASPLTSKSINYFNMSNTTTNSNIASGASYYPIKQTIVYGTSTLYSKMEVQSKEATSDEGTGVVSLYLNNTSIDSNDNRSRLFVCCTQSDSGAPVQNLLSILKGGELYIGGTISGEEDATKLDNKITIENAGIKIDGSSLKIDFSNIQNDSGQSLDSYINTALTGYSRLYHSHAASVYNTYFSLADEATWNEAKAIKIKDTDGNEYPEVSQENESSNPMGNTWSGDMKIQQFFNCLKVLVAFFHKYGGMAASYVDQVQIGPSDS